jgi:hypothetical protein
MFNSRNRRPPTPLEQFIMDYVWAHPNCTAEMCREGLAGKRRLKDSTVRTILRKLEEKGYVKHKLLVGLVDNQLLQPKQLQRLAETIASRKEKIV